MSEGEVLLTLSKAEALVLFEWLASLDGWLAGLDESQMPPFAHPSEEKVLWKVEGQLESVLTEPFAPNYSELLIQARRAVETGE
jgi:hypothetical protein